jgi:hypothetical protein
MPAFRGAFLDGIHGEIVTLELTTPQGAPIVVESVPASFSLSQNYPNPFNPSTTIKYEVANAGKIVIKVYNMLGQEVRTLVNGNKDRGRHEIVWDGRNQFGSQVSSGVYLYRLEAGKVVKTKKMLFIK